MTLQLHISERGLRTVVSDVDYISDRIGDMRPLGWMIRKRWHESERRTFSNASWQPLKASTRRRYRWPVSGSHGGRIGHLTGAMERGLTSPNQVGIKDEQTGNLTITLGVKARGPLHYVNQFNARRPVVEIDDTALEQAAGDVTRFLVSGGTSRW